MSQDLLLEGNKSVSKNNSLSVNNHQYHQNRKSSSPSSFAVFEIQARRESILKNMVQQQSQGTEGDGPKSDYQYNVCIDLDKEG